MADGPQIGTAYLRVAGDFTNLNSQLVGITSASRWGKMGKAAGAALAGGLAAAGAAKALYEIGEAFDDASDKIRVGTGATGKRLKKLEGDFKNVVKGVPTDFDTASTAIADLNTRLEITGKPLQKLSKQFTELSRITDTDVGENIQTVTRLFADWSIKTGEQSKTLDELFRLSQSTGVEISTLSDLMVQFGSPLRQLGIDFDMAAAMFGKFEKEGVNIQTLMPGLRFALKTLSGATPEVTAELEKLGIATGDPEKGLRQVFEQIENAGNAAKANQLAFKVFGVRAGPDMAAAIREGRFELDDLMKTMEDGDETIRKAGRQTMDFAEEWQLLKNNFAVAVEPAATRVFNELGEAMKDVRTIITDKDLTTPEKIDRLADMFSDAIAKAAEKVGEHGPVIAENLAKGLAKGFVQSDVLGQLFIGAAAVRLFGGPGVLRGAGKAIGARIVPGVALALSSAELGKILGEAIRGHELQQTTREELSVALGNVGLDVAGFIGRKNLAVQTAWGRLVFSAETGKVVKAKGDVLKGLIGKTASEVAVTLGKKVADSSREVKWDRLLNSFKDILQKMPGVARRNTDEAFGYFDNFLADMTGSARKRGDRTRSILSDVFGDIADKAKDKSFDAYKYWDDWMGKLPGQGKKHGRKFHAGLGGEFNNLANTSLGALGGLSGETNKTLKSLNVDERVYTAKKVAKKLNPFAKGGFTGQIPGYSKVDDRIIAVRGGEAVLRPEDHIPMVDQSLRMTHGMGLRDMFKKTGAKVPGYAPGGLVQALGPHAIPPIDYAADHAGSNSHWHIHMATKAAVIAIGKQLQQMGFMVGENPAFGGIQGSHSPTGGHPVGLAIDVNSAADETEAESRKVAALLKGKGATAATAEKLARIILEGPEGPLRDGGQAAIDMVRRGANALISKNSQVEGAEAGVNVGTSGPLQDIARRMIEQAWGAGQWPPFNELVQRESGWNPRAVNPSSGAAGLAQALPPSKYPPGAWPYTGKDSAVKQLQWMVGYIRDRYGNPSGAIAHHDANNWYQQGGIVGLQKGGLVGKIHDLYDNLGGLGGGKKGKKKAQSINAKIKELTKKLNKRQRRKQKDKLEGIKNPYVANAVSLSLANWANTYTDKVNITDDALARLEIKHEGTVAPESLEDAMSMLGLTLGRDGEWEGLDPSTQARITGLLDSEFGRERLELGIEIDKNEELLSYLMSQRNSVLVGLKEAEKQIEHVAKEIQKAKEARDKANRQARRIEKDAERLEKRAKNAKGERKRRLQARAAEKRFNARQKRAEAGFHERVIEGLTGRRETLIEGRDEYQSALEEVQGPGSPMTGVLTAMPPLTAGGVPLFGGRLLDVQDRLRDLGSTKIVTPDFSNPEAAAESGSDSELQSLQLQAALDALKNANVQIAQSPVFEDFFRRYHGMFAEGGTIPAGRWGIAGEAGPELIGGPATVTPMAPAAGDTYILVEPIEGRAREISRQEAARYANLERSRIRRTAGVR